ncbi:HlyD family efflux transporter periplasmic adaptor subunit [Nodosilinea sp. LEGE 07088]|uniref:HlyD family efflux transporter periplasmic adaptor subunit n=1 Tax=Nodosilinea sp. LEGE 07088 TaxID=2777968 RepID=UPI001882F423|nr:HlyD family efflux transporter periplasmic adaptor subunit [Nodosilinea sp. LEGE 07088]MBE9138424.1 HlyD family efflux transporter periplasmic adaptor subunit [Nodosilinea sp. LEGE 07088]
MTLKAIATKTNPYGLAAAAMLLLLGGWGLYAVRSHLTRPAPVPAATAPAPVPTVAALGHIEPTSAVIKLSVANAQDSRVNQLLVQEGDRVEANQVIATLQGIEKLQAEVAEAEQNVAVQRAQLGQSLTPTATPGQQAAQRATIRQLEAEQAAAELRNQAAVDVASATLREAQNDYDRYRQLYDRGAVSAADLDSRLKTLDTSRANLRDAEAQLDGARQTLTAQIQSATATLTQLGEVRPVDVTVAEAELAYAQSQVDRARADLEDFYVRVPVAGQILRINTRVGERVNPDQGIVDLGQTEQMVVIAEVYETDVPKLTLGQRAAITSENGGFTNTLQGQVESIGLQIRKTDVLDSDPAADSNARVVEVKVRLDPADSAQVAGLTYMQVRVKIQVD